MNPVQPGLRPSSAEWAVVAAPSNLGLRPPEQGSVPGCGKAPEALREAGLHAGLLRMGASEAGVILPGRYRDDVAPGRLRNQAAILEHSRRLADRITEVLIAGCRPLVLGGDCGILLGAALALRRRGRYGLTHIDGHTDFRHPGNTELCAGLAGEDLAAVVGRHWPAVSGIDELGPYFAPAHVVHVGCRDDDEYLSEVRATLAEVVTSSEIRSEGVEAAVRRIRAPLQAAELDGWWVHLDVDVLDPMYIDAVDSPSPGGLTPQQLTGLLNGVLDDAAGLQVTVFDPDLDPSGVQASLLTKVLLDALDPNS